MHYWLCLVKIFKSFNPSLSIDISKGWLRMILQQQPGPEETIQERADDCLR